MKNNISKPKVYKTDIYVRLSREDGDKVESDSIANQKALIKNYLQTNPEFQLHKIRVDDGYTGVNFDRPAFLEMLSDIKAGKVDCVIVKDLSRFGRNYIDVGKYVVDVFAQNKVRFIAVNDSFDTKKVDNPMEFIFFHFRNMMNDSYCADISMKVRSHLEVKYKSGKFSKAFAPYGYIKSPDDKNKLIVDESVRDIVESIFDMKLDGMSAAHIAEKLNEQGISSPMEHKNEMGIKFKTVFKKNTVPKWNAQSVTRILKNKVYIGTLEQGKSTTPNYKIKVRHTKPETEWIVIENNHESIIALEKFKRVQQLLLEDTRTAPDTDAVHKFSGIVKCAECGGNMTRKTVPYKDKKLVYYVCLSHKNKCGCTSKASISEPFLEAVILKILNEYIQIYEDLDKLADDISKLPYQSTEVKRLETEIEHCGEKIEAAKKYRLELYEDLKEGIISQEEYQDLSQMYTERIDSLMQTITNLETEIVIITDKRKERFAELNKLVQKGVIEKLDRRMVVALINKVVIHDKTHIELTFAFKQDLETLKRYAEKAFSESDTNLYSEESDNSLLKISKRYGVFPAKAEKISSTLKFCPKGAQANYHCKSKIN